MARFLFSALVLAILLPGTASADNLTDKEIAGELAGKEIAWWEQEGWRHGHLFLSPDGVAEMTVDRPVAERDTGRWSLRGDAVCTRWNRLRDGHEKCYRIQRDERGLFLTSGGNVFEVRELGV